MWVAKIRFSSKGTLIGNKAQHHKVTVFGFALSYIPEKNWIIVHIAGTIFGKPSSKRNFFRDLKREERVLDLENYGDFFIGTIKEPEYTREIYNSKIIPLAPALISEDGYEIITFGSFHRKILEGVVQVLSEKREGKLISFQEKKVHSVSILHIAPELTRKQRDAVFLAIKNGYYHVPRKIDVQGLSKIARTSFSTYQVHLRKAEMKLIPYSFE